MAAQCTTKRLQDDLRKLLPETMKKDSVISAFPSDGNIHHWVATIKGAKGTVYEGREYKLTLDFSSKYPYTAPTVKFNTPCYHPNVDQHGNICLDILKEKWSALYDVRTILISIQSLLAEPNNESPLNVQAADQWKNQKLYKTSLEKYEGEMKQKQKCNSKTKGN